MILELGSLQTLIDARKLVARILRGLNAEARIEPNWIEVQSTDGDVRRIEAALSDCGLTKHSDHTYSLGRFFIQFYRQDTPFALGLMNTRGRSRAKWSCRLISASGSR